MPRHTSRRRGLAASAVLALTASGLLTGVTSPASAASDEKPDKKIVVTASTDAKLAHLKVLSAGDGMLGDALGELLGGADASSVVDLVVGQAQGSLEAPDAGKRAKASAKNLAGKGALDSDLAEGLQALLTGSSAEASDEKTDSPDSQESAVTEQLPPALSALVDLTHGRSHASARWPGDDDLAASETALSASTSAVADASLLKVPDPENPEIFRGRSLVKLPATAAVSQSIRVADGDVENAPQLVSTALARVADLQLLGKQAERRRRLGS